MTEINPNGRITPNSLVSIGVLGLIIAGGWAMHLQAMSRMRDSLEQMNQIRGEFVTQNEKIRLEFGSKLDVTNTRLTAIERSQDAQEARSRFRWTSLDMRQWAIQLREANPDLTIPPVQAASP